MQMITQQMSFPPVINCCQNVWFQLAAVFFFFVHTLKQDFSFPVTKKEIPEQPAMTNAMVNLLLEDNV